VNGSRPLKQIILVLILAAAVPTIAAEQPADSCKDKASWQKWQQLLADNPQDDSVASLYAFRIGLCSMVKSGMIDTGRATKLFEQMRDAVISGKLEAEGAGRVEL